MLLIEILEAAGIGYKLLNTKPNEVVLDCPFCVTRGFPPPYAQPHLNINVLNGLAYCFLCHWSGHTILSTARNLCRVYGLKMNLHRQLLAAAEPEKPAVVSAEVKGLPEGYESFGDASDEIEQAVRVYLESRSVSILQIVHHKIGYACVGPMAWRALFPVFGEDGNIYGCVGRAIRGDMKPKYLNTPGIKLLWNAEHLGQFAVVSEGIMDALKIEKVLLQYRNGVSVARLGSSITVHQIGQLKKYERVIIAPDWDVPGIKGAIGLMKRCVAAGITTSVIVPEVMNGYDPGSMAEQDLKIQIDEAIPFTEHVENRLRLAATRMRIPKGLFY